MLLFLLKGILTFPGALSRTASEIDIIDIHAPIKTIAKGTGFGIINRKIERSSVRPHTAIFGLTPLARFWHTDLPFGLWL